YDRWLPGHEHAYQVKLNYSDNGIIRTRPDVYLPLAPALKNEIPGIAWAAPCFEGGTTVLTVGDKNLLLRALSAGSDFLNIVRFPLVAGNASQALQDLQSVVLTQSTAKALFGNTDPIGKTVLIFRHEQLKVTAVIKDLPHNSTMQFDFITVLNPHPRDGWANNADINWLEGPWHVFVGLQPNARPEQVAAQARLLVKKHLPDRYRISHEEVIMQPFKDRHLWTNYENGIATGGLISYVRLFGIIGMIVLIIACINFMNLSTARSEKRAREVGVRKVMGSSRTGLILQFLAESILLTSAAFVLSLLLVQLVLPAFNSLAGTAISIPYNSGAFWLIMSGYVLLTGLLAGSKPAFYLSAFRPVKVLKGKVQTGKAASRSRQTLVVLQFTCSIGLIIATIVIYRQINYAQSRPTGYNPSRLIQGEAGDYPYSALKREVLSTGLVTSMTKSMRPVTGDEPKTAINQWPGQHPNEPLSMAMVSTSDSDYFRTMEIPFIAGTNFVGNFGADSLSIILNETAIKRMRLQQPIGQFITYFAAGHSQRMRIIGVVKDVINASPFAPVEPTLFVFHPEWTFSLTYRLAPNVNTHTALAKLKTIFEKYDPRIPYSYQFTDDEYMALFHSELLIGRLAAVFAGLAILISCLGLFGLAAYVAEQRTKEICIRKILGAPVSSLLLLLTKDFLIVVGISCLIAVPVAWSLLHTWLQQYYYRITIGPGVFALAAGIVLILTIITVSVQAIRAALSNPVDNLRAE
ncbi:MAG: ABC transporter permease, partial [Bacteroidetes bacterium]|nr:ABC transporter permease [Bacteroidota bacterium]